MHHVADEETVLLPAAERALKNELRSLGTAMTRRRLQLLGERPGEIAVTTAGTFPVATLLLGSVLLLGLTHWLPKSRRVRHADD
jgi:hypothetical protein